MLVFAAASSLFFVLIYNNAVKTAIAQLNNTQLIHAKQAARGIEDFFTTWTGVLSSLSKIDAVINADDKGRQYMSLFYEAHHDQIRSITRVNEHGRILYTVPYDLSAGTDISGQEHIRKIIQDHKPVISDVFKTIQGFDAVALHVPVFKRAEFKGTIAIVINFENLAKRYLEVIKIGETGYAWVISRSGITLYSPVPGFTGKSVYESCKDFPSLLLMVNNMLLGRQGTATYTFDKIASRSGSLIKKNAIYMPIYIADTFWPIVVTSSEDEVLSSLTAFRNRLLLILCAVLVGVVTISWISAKAWVILSEEQKRRKTEEDLRASEERYRHLFLQNPAPMLIYDRSTFRLLDVNDAFMNHYGYQKNEALSLYLPDLYPEEEKKPIVDLVSTMNGHTYAGEWHHRKKDGMLIDIVAMSHELVYEGQAARVAVITDITERKRSEDALRRSEEKFFKAFQATPDAIIISRADSGLLLEVNEVFLRLTGYSRDETMGHTAMDLRLWLDLQERNRYIAELKEQGRVREREARFRTKSSLVLEGLVSGETIMLDGQPCLLTIIRDITQKNKIEAELKKHRLHLEEMVQERTDQLQRSQEALRLSLDEVTTAKKDLESANTRLKELDRLKSLFIASMSHELRTPLNSIIGFTGILLQGLAGPLNEEQRKQLSMVKSSSNHLLELITDIIDLSKIEAGRIHMNMSVFDLMPLVRTVVSSLQPAAARKNISLVVKGPDVLEIMSDKQRIRQVLINLTGNAVKFTDRGEVRLTVEETPNTVIIAVRDTGCGIRAEDMNRLFQFFSQITSADMPKYEGTGLGLYISKKLMKLLGGDILATSEINKGSEFIMSMPAVKKETR